MAGAVSDADENRFVFRLSFREGFFAPRIPVYRIVSMLKQVWAFLAYESVGFAVLVMLGLR